MISFLKGQIKEIGINFVTILTNSGVGYQVFLNDRLLYKLKVDEDLEAFIFHNITEVSETLYGFESKLEKEIFLRLIKIPGIGGKVAQSILILSPEEIVEIVETKNHEEFGKIKGIGKKTAEKMILELEALPKDFANLLSGKKSENKIQNLGSLEMVKGTLIGMGYSENEVLESFKNMPENISGISETLAFAIKYISSKK